MERFNWKLKSKKTFLIAFLAFLILFFSYTKAGQLVFKSFLILSREIPANPVKIITLLTPEPEKEILTIQDKERQLKVALIKPKGAKNFPLAIIGPGAGVGIAQESLDKLVDSLARTGLAVAIPDIPEMKNMGRGHYEPLNRSEESLISLFQYFYKQNYVNKNKIGFMGFCIGATLGLTAAEDTSINTKVSFVIADQPSYNGVSMLSLFSKKSLGPNGEIADFEAQPLTIKVLRDIYIEALDSEGDKVILRELFDKGLDISAPEFQNLSKDGKAMFYLLNNTDPKQIDVLREKLPKAVAEKAVSGSPKPKIKNLKAKVFNLANVTDSYIPATESRFLVNDLPKEQIYHLEVAGLNHLEPNQHFKIFQDLKLYLQLFQFIYQTLNWVN